MPSTVDTYGWDTVFAIPIPDVNQAIIDHGSSPQEFTYTGDDAQATADFGAWQVVQGGDGKYIYLSLPLTNLTLTLNEKPQLTFASGTAIIEVQLQYLPQIPDPTTGTPNNLLVKSQPDETTGNPPATLVTCTIPGADIVASAVFEQLLLAWCNANLAVFAHVFATVNLNCLVDQGAWGFVTPNEVSYAYVDGDSLNTSVLGVLCMTGTRTADSLVEQVSPYAIPSGSIAGFLISQARTMDDLVRTAICQAYPTLTSTDLLLSPDGTTLSLAANTVVNLAPVTHNGTTYYPQLIDLTVTTLGSVLVLNSTTTTDISPGITAGCVATNWYTINLGASKNGQALMFQQTQSPSIVHTIHHSEGINITQIIIDIVAAIALIILTIVTDGAALVVAGLLIGLMVGASQIVPALIEDANTDDSPAIDLLLANAVAPITWTDSSAFSLDYGGLNGSFQLGGNPNFV